MIKKNPSLKLILILLILAGGILVLYFLINAGRDTNDETNLTSISTSTAGSLVTGEGHSSPTAGADSDYQFPTDSTDEITDEVLTGDIKTFLARGDFGYEIQTSSDVESVFSHFTHGRGLINWFNLEVEVTRNRFWDQYQRIMNEVIVQQVLPVTDNTYQIVLSYDSTEKVLEEISPGEVAQHSVYVISTNMVRCNSPETCVTESQTNEEEYVSEII